eukprot:TRINITY_DN51188_c0_g1_i2.p1 TRINITY_DN51188_c0_g1~~TRINITY_DN51188_c0_g1_i2.p1  ORF type:complete len:214 (+),score=19.01 TRINITY_DN51188_c0_g1_i2:130-771(+)
MIRRPPRSTQGVSSAASDVYKRQVHGIVYMVKTNNGKILVASIILALDLAMLIGFLASLFIKDRNGLLHSNIKLLSYACDVRVNLCRIIAMILLILDIILLILFLVQLCRHRGTTRMSIIYLMILNFILILILWIYTQTYFYSSSNDCKEVRPLTYYMIFVWLIYVDLLVVGAIIQACSFFMKMEQKGLFDICLLYTSPSPRDLSTSRMPSSA